MEKQEKEYIPVDAVKPELYRKLLGAQAIIEVTEENIILGSD